MFASLFGDVFFRGPPPRMWWLDTLEGCLTLEWPRPTGIWRGGPGHPRGPGPRPAGRAGHGRRARRGLILGSEEIYVFEQPPLLSAAQWSFGNIGKIDFVVGLHLAGQLHEQIRASASQQG